jgi:Protein of unknown function (DUF3035)
MRHRAAPLLLLAVGALALAGCDGLDRALGYEKVVPDEFAVTPRAPLAIPPDYALRPPEPGAAPTQEVSPTDQAKQTIFRAGGDDMTLPGADQRSEGENLLLKEAGASSAAPDIRQTLARDAQANKGPVDQSFIDKLLFWRGPDKPPAADQVIDPNKEAQRLKGSQAAANAAPSSPGLTGVPVIERSRLPQMFGTF